MLCFGDYAQLGPVSNRWRGKNVPPNVFEGSWLSWHWSGGNRFVEQRCRRSDQAHFNFYCELRDMTLTDALERAAQRYPPKNGGAWNIVMSNYRRRKINKQMQACAASGHTGAKVCVDGEVPFRLLCRHKADRLQHRAERHCQRRLSPCDGRR